MLPDNLLILLYLLSSFVSNTEIDDINVSAGGSSANIQAMVFVICDDGGVS